MRNTHSNKITRSVIKLIKIRLFEKKKGKQEKWKRMSFY